MGTAVRPFGWSVCFRKPKGRITWFSAAGYLDARRVLKEVRRANPPEPGATLAIVAPDGFTCGSLFCAPEWEGVTMRCRWRNAAPPLTSRQRHNPSAVVVRQALAVLRARVGAIESETTWSACLRMRHCAADQEAREAAAVFVGAVNGRNGHEENQRVYDAACKALPRWLDLTAPVHPFERAEGETVAA